MAFGDKARKNKLQRSANGLVIQYTSNKTEIKVYDEHNRIEYIFNRDGLEESRQWAIRTLRIYRSAVLQNGLFGRNRHFASNKEFKLGYIHSYLVLKRYYLQTSSMS